MKYHLQLLKKYISLEVSPEDIARDLILKTCEIEEIHTRNLPKTIVIGKITSIQKHPDADKLNVCQVDCGSHGQFQIVCGGTNVAEGIFVPVALTGTTITATGITIAKRPMRGVDSEGMICSKEELEIQEDLEQHWIWNLWEDLEVSDQDLGLALTDKFSWLDTTVLEVDNKSLTNRPDLTGHFGAAIELNAIYPDAVKKYHRITEMMTQFQTTNILEVLEHTEKKLVPGVQVESPFVNSYIALRIENISVKKSDFFSRLQLLDIWGKAINNWVDFSNLFMNISGHPIHCFDADKIKWGLRVRQARDGERFVDLFGTEHELSTSDVVIADEEKVLALGGVIGGLESAVTENTKNIVIELANFDPTVVRKTGTRLGLRTDAELRFEKNINPEYSLYVLLLLLDEMKFYIKGFHDEQISGLSYYLNPDLPLLKKKIVPAPWKELERLIFGVEQQDFEQKSRKILGDLGFGVMGEEVSVPLWRGPDDINIKEDIAEEIARIWGYDQVEPQKMLTEVKNQPFSLDVELTRKLENLMIEQLRFDQVETYPWTSEEIVKQLWGEVSELYRLKNPLNPEFPVLRDSMLYNFIGIAQKNSKFFDEFRIFDIWKVWNRTKPLVKTDLDDRYADNQLNEELVLWALVYKKSIKNWAEDPLLEVKWEVEFLIRQLGIRGKIFFEKSDFSAFHPKKQARILFRNWANVVEIWKVVTVHPVVLKEQKFPETAQLCYFDLYIDRMKEFTNQQSYERDYETLQDQILWRDLSFVVDHHQDFWGIIEAISKLSTIDEVRVFDLYQGENLGEGKKSISLQLKIKWDGSLTTAQINEVLQSAIKKAEQAGAQLRS